MSVTYRLCGLIKIVHMSSSMPKSSLSSRSCSDLTRSLSLSLYSFATFGRFARHCKTELAHWPLCCVSRPRNCFRWYCARRRASDSSTLDEHGPLIGSSTIDSSTPSLAAKASCSFFALAFAIAAVRLSSLACLSSSIAVALSDIPSDCCCRDENSCLVGSGSGGVALRIASSLLLFFLSSCTCCSIPGPLTFFGKVGRVSAPLILFFEATPDSLVFFETADRAFLFLMSFEDVTAPDCLF